MSRNTEHDRQVAATATKLIVDRDDLEQWIAGGMAQRPGGE